MTSRWIKYSLAILLVAVAALTATYFLRYKPMLTMMDKELKPENFRNMVSIFPHNDIEESENPYRIARSNAPFSFIFQSKNGPIALEAKLDSLASTGFLIIRNDTILYEKYLMGASEESRFTSFSVSKSITSLLIGIAIDEGKIGSIQDPVDQYLPYLKGSGWEGISIENVLQMASGIKFSEVYADPDADINQMMFEQFVYFKPLSEWIAGFEAEKPAGETFHYQSINTVMLSLILAEVYGKTTSELLQEKIWQPMGAEYSASWSTDEYGSEMSFGFLNAALRDYAKIGLMMLHQGKINGTQIVPSDWVDQVTHISDAAHHPAKEGDTDYQLHWWLPKGDEGEFMASGYMGQCIYVNPARHVVIVKTGIEESKHLPLMQAIAQKISPLAQPDSVLELISVN
ncbi:MAG: beta-lactamase family protein [Bacteroidia bacterium]|nr:beta-lactamase family protein [Bacteroidia bacterium]